MSRERIALMAILVLATAIPIPVLAQDGVVVQGRVFEFGSTSPIWNARVELEGHGATLTSLAGTFRFEDVEPGEYTLQVDAFGYASPFTALVATSARPIPTTPILTRRLTGQGGDSTSSWQILPSTSRAWTRTGCRMTRASASAFTLAKCVINARH